MRIACLPQDLPDVAGTDIRFDLYSNSRLPKRGRVGDLVPPKLRNLKMRPTERAWDFGTIALSVVAADETVPRSVSPDGWTREIELTIALAAPAFWTTQRDALEEAFRFLTGDIWKIDFIGGGVSPLPPRQARSRDEDMVCLLSGGMDSLVGAIDAVAEGLTPLLVSQMAKGDTNDQKAFAATIAPGRHLLLNHNARPPIASERSQRARSIAFLGFGVLAATCLQKHRDGQAVELRVPENGFISQNVPLTPLRTGTLSTRTTHPYFLARIQSVLDAAKLRVKINNPYEAQTKGEMLLGCKDQATLAALVDDSTSCGRFSRTGFQHCGRCVPCQVRRAAYLKWGRLDTTTKGYKYDPLGQNDHRHARFDDVRAVAMAIEAVRRGGVAAIAGGTISAALLGDVAPYRRVVERGIAELAALHAQLKVP